jgi:hypothetical protein
MRIQFQRDFGSFGQKVQWADFAPDEAALLIAHGIARSASGLTDRAILDRAGRPDPDPPSAGNQAVGGDGDEGGNDGNGLGGGIPSRSTISRKLRLT